MTNSTRSYAERAWRMMFHTMPGHEVPIKDRLEALMQELVNETREDLKRSLEHEGEECPICGQAVWPEEEAHSVDFSEPPDRLDVEW